MMPLAKLTLSRIAGDAVVFTDEDQREYPVAIGERITAKLQFAPAAPAAQPAAPPPRSRSLVKRLAALRDEPDPFRLATGR